MQIAVRLALIFLFLLMSNVSLAITPPQYVIIVDGGSTGSRLHLFQYTYNGTLPVVQELFTENVKPGLSSYASHPQDAGVSLQKPVADAIAYLQNASINQQQVSLSVMATAGMRLLPLNQQQAIYTNVSNYLSAHTTWNIHFVGTIPGQMEALYGWLDVNYLSNTFTQNTPSVGSIDMGGASTQIAFQTSDTSYANNEVQMTINNVPYTIFATSFLGLGQDQAYASMEKGPYAQFCFPYGYQDNVIAGGSFNIDFCRGIYMLVIKSVVQNQTLPAHNNQPFIAYSGAYYSLHLFGLDQNAAPNYADHQITTICSKTWPQLQTLDPGDKYLSGYCANASMMYDLFYLYYQLNGNQLHIQSQINQHDLDWTLGAAFYYANENP